MSFKFPFTNYHELNLTWVLDQLKKLFEESAENVAVIENYDGRLTAVETELPTVSENASEAARSAAAAATLAQTAKATADTAQENAIQAQRAAGTAQNTAERAQEAADAATQAAQQAQATAQNFDGRITQAENDAASALEASRSFENRVQAAITTANNAAQTATNAQGIATRADQNAGAALDKIGDLSQLTTTAKQNLVVAINEAAQSGGGGDNSNCAPLIINTASGAIASFSDGADNRQISKIVGTIVPVQAGTGDPSPDNVRPISGWTGAEICDYASNSLDAAALVNGKWILASNGNIVSTYPNRKATESYQNCIGGNKYYIAAYRPTGEIITSEYYITIAFYDSSKRFISGIDRNVSDRVITFPQNAVYYRLACVTLDSDVIVSNAAILPITFTDPTTGDPMTIYGGTVTLNEDGSADVNAEFVEVIVDGLNIKATVYVGTGSIPFVKVDVKLELFPYTDKTVKPDILSSYCITVDQTQRWGDFNAIIGKTIDETDNIIIVGLKNAGNDVSSFNSFFATNNLQVVARLKTPIVYHFSDIGQLFTFFGTNNVWCDTGDVEVTYPADTKLYIDGKIAELQALVLENNG